MWRSSTAETPRLRHGEKNSRSSHQSQGGSSTAETPRLRSSDYVQPHNYYGGAYGVPDASASSNAQPDYSTPQYEYGGQYLDYQQSHTWQPDVNTMSNLQLTSSHDTVDVDAVNSSTYTPRPRRKKNHVYQPLDYDETLYPVTGLGFPYSRQYENMPCWAVLPDRIQKLIGKILHKETNIPHKTIYGKIRDVITPVQALNILSADNIRIQSGIRELFSEKSAAPWTQYLDEEGEMALLTKLSNLSGLEEASVRARLEKHNITGEEAHYICHNGSEGELVAFAKRIKLISKKK
ncbi:hypothetical protein CBS101457_003027 [Exobasidium rhododendri]|nr:hypothetical protein CBS101457_003027 [Exobasidium rhododendri]